MLSKLFNGRMAQAEYGVRIQPEYGVPSGQGLGEILFFLLKFVILPIIIPIVLTIGVITYAKNKSFSRAKKLWAVAIMLAVYFALFVGACFLFNWFQL